VGRAAGEAAAGRGRSEVVRAHRLVRDLFTPVPRYFWRELAVTGSAAWAVFLLAAGPCSQPGWCSSPSRCGVGWG
jgi:hypothetical protein